MPDLILADRTVGSLIAALGQVNATTIAIKQQFSAFCDCLLDDWVVDAITHQNQPVLDKLRDMLKADPLTVLNIVIKNKPVDKLLSRYCEGSDVMGTYWNAQGNLSSVLLISDSPRCSDDGYFIKDDMQFEDSMNVLIENRNLDIGNRFYPMPVETSFPRPKDYVFNIYGMGILEAETPYGGGFMELYVENTVIPNTTPITTSDVEAGISVNVTEVNGRGDWPGQLIITLALELKLEDYMLNDFLWPFSYGTLENPLCSYNNIGTGGGGGVILTLFFDTTHGNRYGSYSVRHDVYALGPLPSETYTDQTLGKLDADEYMLKWDALSGTEKAKYIQSGDDPIWFKKKWVDDDGEVRGRTMDFKVITLNGVAYVYLNSILAFTFNNYRGDGRVMPSYGWRCGMGIKASMGFDDRRNDTENRGTNLYNYYVKASNGFLP